MAIDANDPRRGSFATGASRQTADAAKASASKARASSPSLSRSTPTRSKSPAASSTAARGASSFSKNQAFGDNDGRSRTSVSKPSGEQQARQTRASFPSIKSDGGRDNKPSMFAATTPKRTFAQQPSPITSPRPVARPSQQADRPTAQAFRPIPRPRTAVPVAPVPLDAPRATESVAEQYLDGPRTSAPIAERSMTPDALADAFFARLGQAGPIGQAPVQRLDRETADARMDAFAGLEERARREALADAFSARREQAGPIGQAPVQRLDRATANARMDDLSDLENRVELEPEFVNNPLAELGYRTAGGLRSVDYLPLAPDIALLPRGGYSGLSFYRDSVSDDSRERLRAQNILGSVSVMDPERADAFADDYVQNMGLARSYLIEPGTIVLGPNYMAPDPQSHEFTHKGVGALENAMRQNPAMRERFPVGLDMTPFYEMTPRDAEAAEERMVELSDDPYAFWNRPDLRFGRMEPTIQYQRGIGTEDWPPTIDEAVNARRQHELYQELAAEELARQGRPPRATMQGSVTGAVQGMQGITGPVNDARNAAPSERDTARNRALLGGPEERNRGLLGGIGGIFGRVFGRD